MSNAVDIVVDLATGLLGSALYDVLKVGAISLAAFFQKNSSGWNPVEIARMIVTT